jgi:hypothetical protein
MKDKLGSRTPEVVELLKDRGIPSFVARRPKLSVPTVINFVKSRKPRELAEKAKQSE